MTKHRATRPPTNWKWWTRYTLYVATTLLINATRTTKQNKNNNNRNKHQNKTEKSSRK